MLQVIPKWKVVLTFSDFIPTSKNVVFWVHDSSLSNVLRKVSDLKFSENGLNQPTEICIGGPS